MLYLTACSKYVMLSLLEVGFSRSGRCPTSTAAVKMAVPTAVDKLVCTITKVSITTRYNLCELVGEILLFLIKKPHW